MNDDSKDMSENSITSPPAPAAATSAGGNLRKALGPGILVACAAIGGSHLVWSTQAGANYGWSLLWLVLLANLLKFPFFYFGQRYTAATGESLLAGYMRRGKGYVWIFLGINILTGTINIAGVGMLSGALLAGYGLGGVAVAHLTVGLILMCALLLFLGHYRLLDGMAKVIIVVLAVATLVAVFVAVPQRVEPVEVFVAESPYTLAGFAFIVLLIGWMPAPIDLSAWSSLWMFSRERQTGHFATRRETAIDFHIGYASATVMAVLFLALGALVMHGSGRTFSETGIGFSSELVALYTETIGAWAHWLILTAAFVTMFSTTLTCVDGYPRSLAACCVLLGGLPLERMPRLHRVWMVVAVASSAVVVLFFVSNLLQLLAFAAAVSFLTSPVLAYINYRVMNGPNVPPADRPGPALHALSLVGLVFFALMALAYLWVLLGR